MLNVKLGDNSSTVLPTVGAQPLGNEQKCNEESEFDLTAIESLITFSLT